MKYLKLFENHNQYYEEISENEFSEFLYPIDENEEDCVDIINSNLLVFTPVELHCLKEIGENFIKSNTDPNTFFELNSRTRKVLYKKNKIDIKKEGDDIVNVFIEYFNTFGNSSIDDNFLFIYKADDEWYYVNIITEYLYKETVYKRHHPRIDEIKYCRYYKCDQFDGVKKLIEDELIID